MLAGIMDEQDAMTAHGDSPDGETSVDDRPTLSIASAGKYPAQCRSRTMFTTASPPISKTSRVAAPVAVAFACALTLCVQGYQFGQSNHTVYLLDPLRRAHPELLKNDWFTTQTLQYHALFGLL